MTDPGLAEIAHDLYGRDPGEFTAARNEASKQAKDGGDAELAAAIKALPKASMAAWLVNQLTRHRGAELDELLTVGDALRTATEEADAAGLKDLNAKRRAVLAAMARRAQALGRELGHPVSDAVAREVEETLHAGLVDVGAAAAVRSGLLVTALSPAGFGSVDLTGAVAAPTGASRSSHASKARKAASSEKDEEAERVRAALLDKAWAAATQARADLEAATGDAAEAETGLGLATAHREQAEADVEAATEALRAARDDLTESERVERAASQKLRAAAKALDLAQRAADRTAAAVQDLQ